MNQHSDFPLAGRGHVEGSRVKFGHSCPDVPATEFRRQAGDIFRVQFKGAC